MEHAQDANDTNTANGMSIDEKIDALAISVKKGFDAVDAQFKSVDAQFADMKSEITTIRATMVTKDYLDDKLADLKGDLIQKLRKEDEKLEFLISLLRTRSVLTESDARNIHEQFRVFPSLT